MKSFFFFFFLSPLHVSSAFSGGCLLLLYLDPFLFSVLSESATQAPRRTQNAVARWQQKIGGQDLCLISFKNSLRTELSVKVSSFTRTLSNMLCPALRAMLLLLLSVAAVWARDK